MIPAGDRPIVSRDMKSLAEHLGAIDPRPEDKRPTNDWDALVDVNDPVKFCQGVVSSREFRQYIMNGVVLGDLPSAVATRIMDHAWGKPPERVEHTGKDGKPIETITEVRRVIVRVSEPYDEDDNDRKVVTTH